MAITYAYNFAEIDNATNMCIGVMSTSDPSTEGPTAANTTYVAIEEYNNDYVFKYYDFDTGKWYYDAEMTQEYIPE